MTTRINQSPFRAYWNRPPGGGMGTRILFILSLSGLLVLIGIAVDMSDRRDPLVIPTYESVEEMVARKMGYTPDAGVPESGVGSAQD